MWNRNPFKDQQTWSARTILGVHHQDFHPRLMNLIGQLTDSYCLPLLMSKRLTSYILHYRSQYAFLAVLIHRQLSNVAPVWKANTFSFQFTSNFVRSKKVRFSVQCYRKAVCPKCFLTIENNSVAPACTESKKKQEQIPILVSESMQLAIKHTFKNSPVL